MKLRNLFVLEVFLASILHASSDYRALRMKILLSYLSASEKRSFLSFFLSSIPFQRTFNAIIVATVCSSELWTCICRAPRSSFLRISLLRRKKRFTGLKKFYAPFDKMHLFVRHWCGLWCSLEIRNASSFRNSWNC